MYKLKTAQVYYAENKIIILKTDNVLIEVQGDSLEVLKLFFKDIQTKKMIEIESYSNELVVWLIENDLIEAEEEKTKLINIAVFGFLSKRNAQLLIKKLNTDKLKYRLTFFDSTFNGEDLEVDNIDFVIVVGPLIAHRKEIYKLNKEVYFKNIPILYFDKQNHLIDVGPIIHKEQNTPCLESFIKRKIANLESPKNYLKIINELTDSQEIAKKNIDFENSYGEQLISIISREIENYLKYNYSSLLGTLITIDLLKYEIEKTKIIKVQDLSYEDYAPIRPFD